MRTSLILIFIIVLFSCGHKETRLSDLVSLDSLESEKQKITIITDTSQVKWAVGDYKSLWIPSYGQLQIADSIIKDAVSKISKSFYRRLCVDSFDSYYRQLVCYTTDEGDSLIYINALCHIYDRPLMDSNGNFIEMRRADWQKYVIDVKDGGDCFWHITIDIRKKKYLRFNVNGEA